MSEVYEEIYPQKYIAYDKSVHALSAWGRLQDAGIPEGYKNEDHFCLECHSCRCYMLYYNNGGRMDGYYVCPTCGKTVTEFSLYASSASEYNRNTKRQTFENDNDWD